MNILVVGDVHGCYHTLKKLIEQNWDSETEYLIQLGDLINKGPNSVKCLRFYKKLQKRFPDQVILLRGNHEQMLLDYFDDGPPNKFIGELVESMKEKDLNIKKAIKWLRKTPLVWENEDVFISHAGVGRNIKHPFSAKDPHGVLYQRGNLRNIGKLQIAGHNIVEGHKPHFNPKENAWHIDTGAWVKKHLSALKLEPNGQSVQIIRVERHQKDNLKEKEKR